MQTAEITREFDDYSQAFAASRAAGAEIIARIGDEIIRVGPGLVYEPINFEYRKPEAARK